MNTAAILANTETEIRDKLDDWVHAVRAKDVARICAHYAPDIVAFDAIGKLQFKGIEAYRKHWETCMTMCSGPMIFELHELKIAANEDLAFVHALNRCGGTGPDGKEMTGWMRMTTCFRRRKDGWRVAHEHFSAPFDMQNDKVLWLEP
jgi:uncharacterized protein (TIGR02246 family)